MIEKLPEIVLRLDLDGVLRVEEIPEGVALCIKEYPEGERKRREGALVMERDPGAEDEAPQVWHDERGYYSLWGYDYRNGGDTVLYCRDNYTITPCCPPVETQTMMNGVTPIIVPLPEEDLYFCRESNYWIICQNCDGEMHIEQGEEWPITQEQAAKEFRAAGWRTITGREHPYNAAAELDIASYCPACLKESGK